MEAANYKILNTIQPAVEFPEWLVQKKQLAQNELPESSLPERHLESWRYTNSKWLSQLSPADQIEPIEVSVTDAQCSVVVSEKGFEVQGVLPDGVEIRHISLIPESFFSELPTSSDFVFNLFNLSFLSNGLWIHIDSKKKVEIEVVYNQRSSGFMHIRNFIHLTKSSRATVLERYAPDSRINLNTEIVLEKKSKLRRKKDCTLSERGTAISYTLATLMKKANLKHMNKHSGGVLQHHTNYIEFEKTDGQFKSGSINTTDGKSNISDIIETKHKAKNCRSHVVHRSLADGDSVIFNNAKAVVEAGADGSDIVQDLKNILLSDDARINSKPELEVYADEVIAAHGSTIGALEEKDIFYLQSRGIPLSLAREILIESFMKQAEVC